MYIGSQKQKRSNGKVKNNKIISKILSFILRKFYIRRNNNKVDSVETGHIVIARFVSRK